MESFLSFLMQLQWLPLLGLVIFSRVAWLEFRSCLGIFSPSGLVSLYSVIKFAAECLVVYNYNSLVSLAAVYGVADRAHFTSSWGVIYSFRDDIYYSCKHLFDKGMYAASVGTRFRSSSCKSPSKIAPMGLFKNLREVFSALDTRPTFIAFFFQSAGGFGYFLSNISSRYEMLAGFGPILKFSTLFIQLSLLYFFSIYLKKSQMLAFPF